MFKKNQVKRSEWFEGLLFAEQATAEGYRIETDFGAKGNYYYWMIKVHEGSIQKTFFCSGDFKEGVKDYLKHKDLLK